MSVVQQLKDSVGLGKNFDVIASNVGSHFTAYDKIPFMS